MSTCHSLIRINQKLTGDHMDIIMFESTKWEFEETSTNVDQLEVPHVYPPGASPDSASALGILRQFPFASARQCMSVVVRGASEPASECTVYCKGSPEKILSLARKGTVPRDFHQVLGK